MKPVGTLILKSLLFLLIITNLSLVNAQAQRVPQPGTQVGEKSGFRNSKDEPQFFVTCTGWHALCTASPDCQVDGDKANCDCMRVNEIHIVATSEIQDDSVKRLTESKCTNKYPCELDEAPICKAIRNGQYKVDDVKYDWVSTYSYRGWCSLLKQIKACDQEADGYTGDSYWAICDAAPCTENQNPSDPERPLSCQCRIQGGSFVGMNSSCTGKNGGIMSSMALWAWDFEKNTYPFVMPGYEYVQGACAPLQSDPLPTRQNGDPIKSW